MDTFDYRGFLAKNRLGPYAKTDKLNEEFDENIEENYQEDEDGEQVTNAPTEPQPIEVVSMGSNGAVIKVRKPNGEEEDVEFELGPEIEEVDPPYGYEGTVYGEIDGVEYGIAVSLVDMGGAGYDMDLSYDGLTFLEGRIQEGNEVPLSEDDMEATKADPNYVQEIVKSYSIIKDLERAGVVSKQELERFLDGLQPIYTRLKGE